MAELVSGSFGSLAGSLQGTVTGVVNQGQGFIDKYFPPEKRAALWARFNQFVTERPKLAAFLLSHIAISGVPLGLFILLTITIALFAIITGLLLGLLGALLFIVFAVGFALVILLPTLFFTTAAATFLFLFGLAGYYFLKWFNEKDIPGIHTGLKDGLSKEIMGEDGLGGDAVSEGDKVPSLTAGDDAAKVPYSSENGESKEKEKSERREREKPAKLQNGSAKKQGFPNPASEAGKATGIDPGNVGEMRKKADVGGAQDKLTGVTDKVPGGLL